jgi:hypothetical protein
MSMDLHICQNEGRNAFRVHGVTGINKNPYGNGRELGAREAFRRGFMDEQFAAAERSLREAAAYHALSVRDNAVDRKWAERLSAA